jgi:hypothetical protein
MRMFRLCTKARAEAERSWDALIAEICLLLYCTMVKVKVKAKG